MQMTISGDLNAGIGCRHVTYPLAPPMKKGMFIYSLVDYEIGSYEVYVKSQACQPAVCKLLLTVVSEFCCIGV
jgi:hypothetical protein